MYPEALLHAVIMGKLAISRDSSRWLILKHWWRHSCVMSQSQKCYLQFEATVADCFLKCV